MAALGLNMKGKSEKKSDIANEKKKSKKVALVPKKKTALTPKKKVALVPERKAPVTPKAKPTPKKTTAKIELRNAQLIVEPSKRRKIRKAKLVMEGELNITNVDAFMQEIEPIFNNYDFLDFHLREVTSLDLCHIQMLYYFQNIYGKKGKTITVDSELSQDLKKVVVNAGFKELMFIPKLV